MSSRLTRKNLNFFYLACNKEFNPRYLSDPWQSLCILQHLNFMCQESVDEKSVEKVKQFCTKCLFFFRTHSSKNIERSQWKANCHLHRMLPQEPVPERIWPMIDTCKYVLYAFGNILGRQHFAFFLGFIETFHICIRFSTSLLLYQWNMRKYSHLGYTQSVRHSKILF